MPEKLVEDARPHAAEFAAQIVSIAQAKDKDKDVLRAYAATIASLTFQTVIITIMAGLHDPGSQVGEDFIEKIFETAKESAVERWNSADLKDLYTNKSHLN